MLLTLRPLHLDLFTNKSKRQRLKNQRLIWWNANWHWVKKQPVFGEHKQNHHPLRRGQLQRLQKWVTMAFSPLVGIISLHGRAKGVMACWYTRADRHPVKTHIHTQKTSYSTKTSWWVEDYRQYSKGTSLSQCNRQQTERLSEFIITEVWFVWTTLKSHALGTGFNQEVSYQLICDVSNFKVRTKDKWGGRSVQWWLKWWHAKLFYLSCSAASLEGERLLSWPNHMLLWTSYCLEWQMLLVHDL